MYYKIMFTTILSIFLFAANSSGGDVDSTEKALNMIADYAERICGNPPLEGKSEKVELTGDAKFELNKLLKSIAGIGIEGGVKYQSNEYQNVLQEDLAEALRTSIDCKVKVTNLLVEKLIPNADNTNIKDYVPRELYESFLERFDQNGRIVDRLLITLIEKDKEIQRVKKEKDKEILRITKEKDDEILRVKSLYDDLKAKIAALPENDERAIKAKEKLDEGDLSGAKKALTVLSNISGQGFSINK